MKHCTLSVQYKTYLQKGSRIVLGTPGKLLWVQSTNLGYQKAQLKGSILIGETYFLLKINSFPRNPTEQSHYFGDFLKFQKSNILKSLWKSNVYDQKYRKKYTFSLFSKKGSRIVLGTPSNQNKVRVFLKKVLFTTNRDTFGCQRNTKKVFLFAILIPRSCLKS